MTHNKIIYAWATYDWANSAFAALVVTFVYSAYFTQAIAPDEVTGMALWSWAVTSSGILVALAAPFLGLIADRGQGRHRYLTLATLVCITATAALTFIEPGQPQGVLLALVIFVIANVAFEIGMVFYNAFLPDIAPPERLGRVSGLGWGLGYVGGIGCLAIALLVFVRDTPLFGIATEAGFHYRATNLLVALWFLVFSLPMLVLVPRVSTPRVSTPRISTPGAMNLSPDNRNRPVDKPPEREPRDSRRALPVPSPAEESRRRSGQPETFGEWATGLWETLAEIRAYRDTLRLLLARLIYNDGLVTVFAFGGIYAAGTFDMPLSEVIRFGIAINIAAALGTWVFGSVDDRFGGKVTILITLLAMVGFTLLAAMAPDKTWFWVAGLGIGIFVGPNQAASRSLLSRFAPARHRGEFFGFFAFSGKLTAFLGPLLMGIVTQWSGSQRVGIATALVFFIVGGVLLLGVDEKRGVARAQYDERALQDSRC
uniref:MFS transporter, UMF1 family n=1 Tax=Candidatus Kentrum sp. FM TaxID=2126340 RepID=A0A450TWT0_9GAMM|nr:MAG: MFS transporter, UMF1 family [Candidatus Kentron sp. FM]VFJ74197.1 MAG: MFS transporter, UMF1 family [Candidatus Kentron sp. FM]VFK19227.1 MAG: MFS transporter, UMF1 family [Candidatus Kentron sp. FM]